MKIFLDVGANTGQTVEAVLDPKYRFDRIICFEPVQKCCKEIARLKDYRITIFQFGLWRDNCQKTIFEPGSLCGSIFADHNDIEKANSEVCKFVKASDWFRENISKEDVVFLKLNCEGSECDIVDDLLESGEYKKVAFMMIDFDVRKIPSQQKREIETRRKLNESGFKNYAFCEDVMIGTTHAARIQYWLNSVGADKCSMITKIRQFFYVNLQILRGKKPELWFKSTQYLQKTIPNSLYVKLQHAWRLSKRNL